MMTLAHVLRVAVETRWGGCKIWMLASTPRRMLGPHPGRWHPLIGMMRRWRRTWYVCPTKREMLALAVPDNCPLEVFTTVRVHLATPPGWVRAGLYAHHVYR